MTTIEIDDANRPLRPFRLAVCGMTCVLTCGNIERSVVKWHLERLGLFQGKPDLLAGPRRNVRSRVSGRVLAIFCHTINRGRVVVTDADAEGLCLLSAEFGFHELAARIAAARPADPEAGAVQKGRAPARSRRGKRSRARPHASDARLRARVE